jgi:hypothetical protein
MSDALVALAVIIFILLLIFFFPLVIKFGIILYYWLFPPENPAMKATKSFKLSEIKEVKSEKIR